MSIAIYIFIYFLGCKEIKNNEKILTKEVAELGSISEKEGFLESIFRADQSIRDGERSEILLKFGLHSQELQEFHYKMDSIDQLNLKKIELYLKSFAYPEKGIYSQEANIAPWLVIHHCSDIQARNRFFQVLKGAYLNDDIDADQFELYLSRTYQMKNGEYPGSEGPYRPEDKIKRLVEELDLE